LILPRQGEVARSATEGTEARRPFDRLPPPTVTTCGIFRIWCLIGWSFRSPA